MPDESCRRCGGMLLDYIMCGKCKATTQFICRICAHKTTQRFHEQLCFRIDGFYSNSSRHTTQQKTRLDNIITNRNTVKM